MNIIVLDLETARSAEDCMNCVFPKEMHETRNPLGKYIPCQDYEPIGWTNKPFLGLSIGCFYDYLTRRICWFDTYTLEANIEAIVDQQPLMVSFNGIQFDFPLMRGLLRREAEAADSDTRRDALTTLCDDFKALAAQSYDLLAEIWKIDPKRKFERGLNSLDAIAQANGLGPKLSHGAQAPRDWAAGRHAQVLNYCQDDVYKTKALFEMVLGDQPIKRGDGSEIKLPMPSERHQNGQEGIFSSNPPNIFAEGKMAKMPHCGGHN